jgi:hypothetical protein
LYKSFTGQCLWYAGPNAINNVTGFAKFYSRSHKAVMHVYDASGNVIETRAPWRFQRVVMPSVQSASSMFSHKRKKKVSTFVATPTTKEARLANPGYEKAH